ncbi:MAG: hypothetical protein REI96_06375 [Flavobacterium nitrogenifigens]|uniref:hypothetical protein n=1 Tax=Flavobacterium nitrogenifigens TaxID=1617283 RepID=UPI00280A023A|nr:hypothetical protein [Flavobacterium nitrogenifigens]MDQ8012053.1 hypothetical protein [Flavobacterium nitrogenifigens]
MATPINTILNWFKTGLKPTQDQFWSSWLSFWHKDEQIPQSSINNLTTVLNAKAEKSQFDSHKTDVNAHPELVKKARIIPLGEELVIKTNSNTDTTKKEIGDFCIRYIDNVLIHGTYIGNDDTINSYEVIYQIEF